MLVKQIDDLAAIAILSFLLSTFFISYYLTAKDDIMIINYIKTKDKISLEEVLQYCKQNIATYRRASTVIKLENKAVLQALTKRIINNIRQGHLTGYRIEESMIIKTEKSDEE